MPDSWNESIREFYEDDEEDPDRDPRHEPDESTNLVRKASMGRKHKPQLTTVKSGGSLDKDLARAKVSSPKDDAGRSPPRALHDIQEADHANVYGTGATFLDPSSSSDETVRGVNAMPSGARIQNAAEVAVDGRARLLSPREINRPPRLDLKAVRETEQRGSLTSLPDLIRRATRLASNLDRGKTASRLGMLDMFNSSDPKLLEKANRQSELLPTRPWHPADRLTADARNTNSITDMLASFPPPGLGTPTPTGDRPSSRWPSPFANGQDLNHQYMSPVKPEGKRQKQQRRCCGMPVWAFTVSMLVLLIFVAAAVIIPMVLIVIPRQNASASFNYAVCPTANPCANGGSSVVSNNSCRCICANGFTGSTCATAAGPNCTTLNMDNYPNATAGSSIPRLLTAAQTNFSVPLNATLLLSLFSATNISCASEDSLVTFSSGPQRREIAQQVDLLAAFEGSFPPHPTPVAQLAERGAGAAASTTAIPIATAPPSTQAQGSTMPGNQPITQSDLDFGRVAVLFVMQESNDPSSAVNSGIVVLDRLQGVFLGNTFSPGKVMVGNNVTVDFATATIDMGNGTVVGGKGLR
jgi:hypothetical protein